MRVTCPCCYAELDLLAMIEHEGARRAVASLASISLPFGALTLKYMAMFKPPRRALSIERMVRLIDELLIDIKRGAVTRNGRDWPADVETWRTALQVVMGLRDAGTLRLPLTGHGLLHQVIANLVDKHEAQAERSREADRRSRSQAGPRDAAPRDLGAMAADVASSPMPLTTHAPPPAYRGPSRAALETRARIEAALAARQSTPQEPPAP